jgi:hypothetical protein
MALPGKKSPTESATIPWAYIFKNQLFALQLGGNGLGQFHRIGVK